MRIVLLGLKNDRSLHALYHALKDSHAIAAVVKEDKEPLSLFLKRRIRKLGYMRVISQIAFKLLVVPVLQKLSQPRIRALHHSLPLNEEAIPETLIVDCENVNATSSIEKINQYQPEAILVNGTRILSKEFIAAMKCPVINTHVGITPLYRGVHGAYWALVNQDAEHCGVTVHLIDAGIDTGGILYQEKIHPTNQDNFITYPLLQLATGITLLKKTLNDLSKGEMRTIPPVSGSSKLWYHPGIGEYLWNGLRKKVW
ncbi:MAG: formyl transferase [Cytophagaceae bacterium]|jgi:methionyl-tRNA formyltransferase|nr:formyl transferase [Cytophagaceae bacterium]